MRSQIAAHSHSITRCPGIPRARTLLAAWLLVVGVSLHAAWGQELPPAATSQPSPALPSELSLDDEMAEAPIRPPRIAARDGDEPLLKTLGEFYPEQARRLRQLRENNPKEFARVAGQMRPWLRQLRDARARSPELARSLVQKHRIEMAINDWQRRYCQAPPEEREALMAEGRQLAQQRVEHRLQHSRMEIQVMEKRLEGLKARLQEREPHKDAIIERELSNMVNPPASQPARPNTR